MSYSSDEEDYEWEINDEEGDESMNYGQEFNVYERTGPGGINLGLVGPDGKIDRSIQEPLERFQIYVDAISRGLMNEELGIIAEQDIQIMLEKAKKLNNVNFKNPSAYILGYISSKGGKQLTKIQFNYVKNTILSKIIDTSINPEDILRYSRLWTLHLK